jgi:hypothetical protein
VGDFVAALKAVTRAARAAAGNGDPAG